MSEATIGDRLIALKEQSGLSLAKIASSAGYQGASSIQKLFRPDYNPRLLSRTVAERLANALVGYGTPPILESEIYALTSHTSPDDVAGQAILAEVQASRDSIIIHQTGISLRKIRSEDGYIIPAFSLNEHQAELFYASPHHLTGQNIAGIRVVTSNMWPRFDVGEVIFFSWHDSARIGDLILVSVKPSLESTSSAFVLGRMLDLNDEQLRFTQLKPERINILNTSQLSGIFRIMSFEDLLPKLSADVR